MFFDTEHSAGLLKAAPSALCDPTGDVWVIPALERQRYMSPSAKLCRLATTSLSSAWGIGLTPPAGRSVRCCTRDEPPLPPAFAPDDVHAASAAVLQHAAALICTLLFGSCVMISRSDAAASS